MYKKFKHFVYRLLIPFIRMWKKLSWNFYLITHKKIKIVVGAGPTKYRGWFSTDIVTLDVTNEEHFKKYFKSKKINRVLAEHVLEHLTDKEIILLVSNLYNYSSDDINIRIAVPDGLHKDEGYINTVKPGGTGIGADDHKHLFNYNSLASYFEKYNFTSYPLEYWDENQKFHSKYSNDENGYVIRTYINDKRNVDGTPRYTSLIVDFRKT